MYLYEQKYYAQGCKVIAGIDEVGRGPWAGPLVVAICVLPKDYHNDLINDSKKINEKKREEIYKTIVKDALYIDSIFASAEEIDKFGNIKSLTKNLMAQLIKKCPLNLDIVLIDAEIVNSPIKTHSIIKGDEKSITIAAASIVAKVQRDRYMIELNNQYPQYYFADHKGYGTKKHIAALVKYGPIKTIHRYSFEPIQNIIKAQEKK